jgi:hypothetical protein
MSTKYKIGDKVKIKTWQQMEKEYGLNSVGNINSNDPFPECLERVLNENFLDRILTITEVGENKGDHTTYILEEVEEYIVDEDIEYSLEELEIKKRRELEEYGKRPVITRFDLMDFSDES